MADWATIDLDEVTNDFNNRSHQSSLSSGHSDIKENSVYSQENNHTNSHSSSKKELILGGGTALKDESRTELTPLHKKKNSLELPELSPQGPGSETAKTKTVKSQKTLPSTDSTPAENLIIPNDANISSFTCDQLVSFLKCLKIEDKIISYLHRKSVDGKRFAKMKDSELDSLGINNPVVVFFRNKSNTSVKGKGPFML